MNRAWIVIAGCLVATVAGATDFERVKIIGAEAWVEVETPHPVPRVDAGELAWRETFHWPGASYIAVHFERFEPAPGERVVVRTPDGSRSYTFAGEGKRGSGGTFWATHVPGDTCEVLYYGNGAEPGWGVAIDRFAHGYPRQPDDDGDQFETVCGDDDGEWAKCYQDTEPEIYDKSRAIARLTINGIAACTGWLVGCEGHLMTNAHCITNPGDALNTDYEFMAEGATCETDCAGSGACPGIVEASSGTLVQAGTQLTLDYALVQLPAGVSEQYGYFKLRPTGPEVDERIYLNGHPQAWGKRFEVLSSDPTDESGYCEIATVESPPAPGCSALGPVEAGYMCDTQSGSSGSPVVAYSDHRVVVLHHCGGCENTGVLIQDVIADLGANVPACALDQLAGIVAFDAPAYGCSSVAAITVRDESIAGAGSQDVSVSSDTEASPESVTLTEAPAGSGTFRGQIQLTDAPPAAGDGQLSVDAEETITVVYIDADDGQGNMNVPRTDSAAVDCRPPAISDVSVSGITGEGATITWTTDEPATSQVRFGTSPPPAAQQSSGSLVGSHSVQLAGLEPCTTYYFSVHSRDEAGNQADEDASGALFTFTTLSHHILDRSSTDTPVSIPDNDPTGTTSTIVVTDAVTVTDVDVEIDITHTYDGDIRISLLAPDGTEILLSDQRGDDGDDYRDTVFDDEAPSSIVAGVPPFTGRFRPEKPLSLADGIQAAGEWKLKVVDLGPTDFGTIDGWTLTLGYAGGCGASAVHESSSPADTCAPGGGGGGNGRVEPGEEVDLPLVLRNDGTSPLTAVSATLSSSTPGVTVTRATASFPDLAVGSTGASAAPHYAVVVGTGVPCGSTIDFTLAGQASEGAFGDSFQLEVGASGLGSTTYESTEVPRPVPDLLTTTSTVTVADTDEVHDVDVRLSITHTYDEDLDLFLVGPDGTRVELSTDNGASGDNYTNTIFDDEAAQPITAGMAPFTGRFRPEGSLAAFDGLPADGTWTLEITDDTLQDPGILDAWSLQLTTGTELACDACPAVAPAGEVANLVWEAGPTTRMRWDAAGDASFYNVYRGQPSDLAGLLGSETDSCLRASVGPPDTGETLDEEPAAGSFFWYLVRAASAGGEGPAGQASAGERVQDGSGACP